MRNFGLDNAKFCLIFLIIFGHSLQPLLGTHPLLHGIYIFIYSFHVPALAFLSGSTSSSEWDEHSSKRLLFGIIVPYLLFQVLYKSFEWMLFHPHNGLQFAFSSPDWLLWYLVSLATWRIMLLLFSTLRFPLSIAVLLALLVGFLPYVNYTFSLSRTFVFFPFFLLGYSLKDSFYLFAEKPNMKRAAAIAALCIAAFIWMYKPLDQRIFYGSLPYTSLEGGIWVGCVRRGILLFFGTIMTLAFFILVPKQESWMSKLGEHGMQGFLLHGFLMKFAIAYGLYHAFSFHAFQWIVFLTTGSFLLSMTLCSPNLAPFFKPILHPGWLERLLARNP